MAHTERIDHSQVIIDSIDRALVEPPLTIEQALDWAVQHGHMKIVEAEECLEAYHRVFNIEP